MTPSTSQRGTIANKFLLKKVRSPHHIIVSSNPVCTAHHAGLRFEEWPRWLDGLHRHLVSLVRKVEGDRGMDTAVSNKTGQNLMVTASGGANDTFTPCFPVVEVLQELEQVLAVLSFAAATNTRDSDMTTSTNSGVYEAQPPVGWAVKLLLDVGYSYGAILDLYCLLLEEAHCGEVISLDVINEGGFTVDPSEVRVANDNYMVHLLEGALYALVQWLEMSMKHTITRGKDGTNNSALSELIRYNESNPTLISDTAHAEEKGNDSGGLGSGKLASIFEAISEQMQALLSDRTLDGSSSIPAVQAYGGFRRDSMARLLADLEGAKLLQRRFVTDM